MSVRNPVLIATAAYARAVQSGDEQQITQTRKGIVEAKLRRAVDEALAATPPLSPEVRESIASLLSSGGGHA